MSDVRHRHAWNHDAVAASDKGEGEAVRMSKLVQVMAILLHHEPQAECSAERDKMWLGGPRPSDLTGHEAASLTALGVRWSDLHESWEVST